jgi:hypothetical protein
MESDREPPGTSIPQPREKLRSTIGCPEQLNEGERDELALVMPPKKFEVQPAPGFVRHSLARQDR